MILIGSISGKTATEIFSDSNPWLLEKIEVVLASKQNDMTIDADLEGGIGSNYQPMSP